MEDEMSLSEPNHRRLSVVYQNVSALKPRTTNPRTHSKKQIVQIANAIRRFGFTNPVLVDDVNGIIAGHGRVEAAKVVGLDQVPTGRLEQRQPSPDLRRFHQTRNLSTAARLRPRANSVPRDALPH